METAEILSNNNQNAAMQSDTNLKPNEHLYEMRAHFPNKTGQVGICYYRLHENDPSTLQNYENAKEQSYEEPIDLTCDKRRIEFLPSNNYKVNVGHNCSFNNAMTLNNPKKRGRKRKIEQPLVDMPLPVVEANLLNNLDTSRYVQDSKKVEVLKAAKSLFSKRTRTLYHWMYPNTPKAQLKAAVATSWEALGAQEKEFYISQVLGRFGFPQSNLMVNPQLGGISGSLPVIPMVFSMSNHEAIEETSSAVSTILHENNRSWAEDIDSSSGSITNYSPYTKLISRKCGKKNKLKNKNKKYAKENVSILKEVGEEVTDEFQDDPELSREFQQFKWNLHFNENKT
ncbi:hypothetical protein RN001_006818 [Aquatica leii]|uniref:Uncharacterized protein n=1 Tax=Aquatica leii TaxID=1421715 RepID=A0AAN7SK26_9COLE|nr:hypothetical protein RN001_006818 [Aquatica leii]